MTTEERHRDYLARALLLADANVQEEGGRPFGAVLVRDGQVIAEGVNTIHRDGDPTAHAEIQAIRAAATASGSPRLDGAIMYASGHPCPMCLAAMYLCGISHAYFALSQEDGQPYDLSTEEIYAELARSPGQRGLQMEHLPLERGPDPYARWAAINRQPG